MSTLRALELILEVQPIPVQPISTIDRYRHLPFFTNTSNVPAGIDRIPLEVGTMAAKPSGLIRRMLHDRELVGQWRPRVRFGWT